MAAHPADRLTALLLGLLAAQACGSSSVDVPEPEEASPVRLHTVMEMGRKESVPCSHVGDELSSVLQPIYSTFQDIPHQTLTVGVPEGATSQQYACYPRIKKMADGRYILFWHSGAYGSRIWYMTSPDFLSWSDPVMLYEPVSVTVTGLDGKREQDWRRFVNPDAVVLRHGARAGDLLLVCSYRATSHYRDGLDCGLSFRRSTDHGKSWEAPVELPVGPNWEPYLLELPDGRIHCYYTDATPKTRNSGTSLIVSGDGGRTWSAKKRVCRQYKYDFRTEVEELMAFSGEKVYTDQMPCFRVLPDGKSLVGWLEARLETPMPSDCGDNDTYSSHYEMSLVYNGSFEWEDLGENAAGPSDRSTNIMRRGTGGYVAVFPSGEVLLSCTLHGQLHMRMCDAAARKFYGSSDWTDDANWLVPFPGVGLWGTMEVCGSNLLAAAMPENPDGDNPGAMQMGLFYLNQRIDAGRQAVTVDGDPSEWATDQAFFIASKDGKELLVRAAADERRLYLAVDRRDPDLTPASRVTLLLAKEGAAAPVSIRLGPDGLLPASQVGVTAICRRAVSEDGAGGYAGEVAVPLSLLGAGKGDTLRLYALLEEGDVRTPFSFADGSEPGTWQKIRL